MTRKTTSRKSIKNQEYTIIRKSNGLGLFWDDQSQHPVVFVNSQKAESFRIGITHAEDFAVAPFVA